MRDRYKVAGKIVLFSIILSVFLFYNNVTSTSHIETPTSLSLDPQLFEVEKHSIKIDIQAIDEINIAERYTVKNRLNTSLDSIEIWINQSMSDLTVTDYNGSLTYDNSEISQSSHLLNITFRSDLEGNSSTTFDVWYNLEREPIAENGNSYYYFEFFATVSYFTLEQIIEVKIPERSFIHEEEGLTSYFPLDGFALAGQRVYLSWTFENLEPLHQTFIFVRFDKPLRETPIIAIVLGTIGGLVLGACLTILFMRRREKKVVKEISTIYLSDTQKIILNLISENDGKMLQKELCAETGFTKSRVSRNITPLVEQGLLQRDRWGRNYVIKLTDSGRKVTE
ncbi:MAG: helix-turn-helix transcriptional regulator [Candidatus Heimdallarchaeaceae archaeon]